jgi:uncharacterized protein (TIGR02147 family)
VSGIIRPNLYRHHDVREALREQCLYAKKAHKVSLRELARRIEVSSGLLTLVLNNERGLSEDILEKLLGQMTWLDASEKSFLKKLRTLSETEDFDERRKVYKKLTRFHKQRESVPQNYEGFRYLTHWFYPVLRELVAVRGFHPSVDWIQEAFQEHLSPKQIIEGIEFLFELGYIEQSPDGQWRFPNNAGIQCEAGVFRLGIGQFHKEMLNRAVLALDELPREERSVQSLTMAMSEKSYTAAQKILSKALDDIQELVGTDPDRTRVYHLALASFPLTRKEIPPPKGTKLRPKAKK